MISKIRESPLDAASIIDSFDQSILLTEPKSDFEKVRKLKILPLKIVLFGDDFPGKNTLIQRFLIPRYDQTKTLGADFALKVLTVDGQKIKLQIWVFSGEERFRSSLPTYLRGAQGGMFLFDVTNRESIDHIEDWLSVIRKEMRAENRFPILAVGVVPYEYSSAILDEQVTSEEAIEIAKSRNLNGFIECTPKTGEKVEKAFESLTRLILDI